MAEGGFKHIKIDFGNRKYLIRFTSHDEFMEKCREKFNFGQDEQLIFTRPGDDMEIESECITDFPNETVLQLQKNRHVSPAQTVSRITSTFRQLSTDDSRQINRALEVEKKHNTGSDEYLEEIQWFKWDDDKALRDYLSVHGTRNIAALLDDSLESWRRHPVNIAIIGQSGKGKSSLINALRGVDEFDVQGAKVGEKETTTKCTPYRDPKYDNIVYWDVPGCGTTNYPKSSYMYLFEIDYQLYDYFLIVSSERFHEMDISLAKTLMIQKDNTRCYLIRSKVDIDMASRQRREKRQKSNLSADKIFQNFKVEVKTDIIKALGDKNLSIQLFLLSSHDPDMYEFRNLQLKLIEDALTEKRLSLVLGMNGLAKPLLDYKRRALRSRQWKVACKCISKTTRSYLERDFSGLIHVIFSGFIPVIIPELEFYQEQLSLDNAGLQSIAHRAGITVQVLKSNIELKAELSRAEMIQSLSNWYTHCLNRASIFDRLMAALGWSERPFREKMALNAVCAFLDHQLNAKIISANKLTEHVRA